jgi:Rrf2 family protein
MHISVCVHHALRIMLDLAMHSDETPVFRHVISERQGITPGYIAQICRKLNKAGLLKSTMGPEGGYGLSRPASEIKINEIINAIEGPVLTSYCVSPGNNSTCNRKEECTTRLLWLQLSQVIESYLNGITLQDICDQSEKLDHKISFLYTPNPFLERLGAVAPELGCAEASENQSI